MRLKFDNPTLVFIFACLIVAMVVNVTFYYPIVPSRRGTVVQYALLMIAHDPLNWLGMIGSSSVWVRPILFLSHTLLVTLVFALPAFVVLFCGKRFAPNWLTNTLILAWCGLCFWAYFGTPLIDAG